MGSFLCLYPDRLEDGGPIPVVMWTPAKRQMTYLGSDFSEFLERESHRRLEFLLGMGSPLDEAMVAQARRGEKISFDAIPEEGRLVASLVTDVCRIAEILALPESIFERAAGKAGSPSFLREVDGRDEPGIDQAINELKILARKGDAAAAFEVLGFLQIRQNTEEVARWAYLAAMCPLYTWPDFSPIMVSKVADLIKANAAAIPATERLDPLFGFMTTQPSTKVDARLNLAKQYMRKKDYRSAIREAENSVMLAHAWPDRQVIEVGVRNGYQLLVDIFQVLNRPRELAYAEILLSKSTGS